LISAITKDIYGEHCHVWVFAGGDITLGSVLKMRDEGIGLPAAVVVEFSPNADLTFTGDTVTILKEAGLVLNSDAVRILVSTYADPSEHMIPSIYDNNHYYGSILKVDRVGLLSFLVIMLIFIC
jgi:hypothetical protein